MTLRRYLSSSPTRSRRMVYLPLPAMILCTLHAFAQSQTPQLPPQSLETNSVVKQSTTSITQDNTTSPLNASPLPGGPNALSTQQILNLLEARPEIVVELKQLTADQLTQEGLKIQADAITDEVLYNQIASTPALRETITSYLLARGYISGRELQQSRSQTTLRSNDLDDGNDSYANGQESGGLDNQSDQLRRDAFQSLPSQTQLAGAGNDGEATGDFSRLPDSTDQAFTGRFPGQTSFPANRSSQNRNPLLPKPARDTDSHNTTDIPDVLRQPAPYNLLSLRDLYTQIPEESGHLKRFGSEVFLNRPNLSRPVSSAQENPLDIPIGPDYVVGPGDSLSIDLWGGISQTLTRVIDREGRITLPEAGTVSVAGLTLERAQAVIESTLKQQYRNAQVAVTVARLRSVRIYVVGDVQRPGAYDISSLASPLNALYAAGGPTAIGSLRTLDHYRGKQLIAKIDLYDFLAHGIRSGDDRFQGGDTLLVPPAGPQVAVSGTVKRPAIYELNDESTLAQVLEDAGGATVAASLGHITIERIDANQQRETVTLEGTQATIAAFAVKDGDRIYLAPILPFSERAIYLEGHVVRPGRLAYRDGMHLNDVLHSYQDILPEPATQGEIIRLVPPDLHVETIEFNVADVLIGNLNFTLQPFDTIRILGRYQVDSPRVTIRGEVLQPGIFPLSEGMTAAQLVRLAGGFRRAALQQDADLTSYEIVDGKKVIGQRSSIRIGDAVNRDDHTADVVLKPGDILTIHQITGWTDIGASVTIEGEASHPGSYGFQEGERLSSVLRRAGGLRATAYPEGAVLLREQVRDLEEKSRAELIRQIESSSAASRITPNITGNDNSAATLQLIQQQQDQVLARLRSEPASGRLVIHITSDIASWENTDADIEVRRGDILSIPKRPGFVLVSGQVYNASAITFVPGKTASWYLERVGGASDLSNRKEIFIIRANGSVVGRHSGAGHVLDTRLDAGDVVVVPQKIRGGSEWLRNLLAAAQVASSIALTSVVAGL